MLGCTATEHGSSALVQDMPSCFSESFVGEMLVHSRKTTGSKLEECGSFRTQHAAGGDGADFLIAVCI